MIIMSEEKKSNEKIINLCVRVNDKLAKDFYTEVVKQHGQAYGNTGNCIKEAIKLWIDKAKKNEKGKA